jgi:hypothetical protein
VDKVVKDPGVPATREILSYFLRHPAAADSLTGIARWRLMEETVRQTLESTETALRWLISEGYLSEESRLGSERIYQLNPERREQAEQFLHEK